MIIQTLFCAPLCCTPHMARTNPQVLQTNKLWQLDITRVNLYPIKSLLFGVINPYSHFIWIVPMTSERAKNMCIFLL